jgi:hypothetical protein
LKKRSVLQIAQQADQVQMKRNFQNSAEAAKIWGAPVLAGNFPGATPSPAGGAGVVDVRNLNWGS